jgi:hypothetical protein
MSFAVSPLSCNDEHCDIVNTVFDISWLRIVERFAFTNVLCEAIMDARANHPNPTLLPWVFIVSEEAQLYLPNGCKRSLRKCGSVLDVVTVGRNYNVRLASSPSSQRM